MEYAPPLLLLLSTCVALRLYAILPREKPSSHGARSRSETCSLAVFLGSGGHTSEALALLTGLDFDRYCFRKYVVSEGDILSAKKAITLESEKVSGSPPHNAPYSVLTIPRARRVHQSLLTTPISSVWSLIVCVYHITLLPLLTGQRWADVLVLNGPGTCVMLCLAVYLNRFLGLPSPKLVYIESFARVKRLSLSGKILRPFVDRFLVQWPELARENSRAQYRGCLV
ncbi:glycosyltransferase family 1 protein [Phlebiopsis gigantea 11061_1 CR5-6]|uniref:UDP-N-acetylglucosamine transferase subunit ALG14 n=1 Tax=Phlebiopsis gigantea (strain 11061_1 CR5-6) TaxID=745531 RepID=A0A0C3SC15_PHLG1|nr:glycosyltransferase family 1 protein [Phlebiopsis gigantea 11061_1 CR5-6]